MELNQVSYLLEETPEQPDVFIEELISDLCSIQSRLNPLVTVVKQEFLFGDLAALLRYSMIKSLKSISNINRNGVLKIRKDVFAMLQALPSNIVISREYYFDEIRIYYDMLQFTPDVSFFTFQKEKIIKVCFLLTGIIAKSKKFEEF